MSKGIASFTDEPFLLNMINKKQLAKHFAGQHDQSTHGSWAHGDVNDFTLDSRFQDAVEKLSTQDVNDINFKETEVGKFFTEYAEKTVGDSKPISGYDTITPKELQFRAMRERLLDEIDANAYVKDEDVYKSFEDDIVPEVVSAMENGKVCIAMDAVSFQKMMDSGDPKFKTQFETATSNGYYDPTIRRAGEARSQSIPVSVNDAERPIYGYSSVDDFDESIMTDGVEQYGVIRFVLKDSVKQRSTMTLGDSLNRKSISMKMNKTPSVSDVIRATEHDLRGNSMGWSGLEDYMDFNYLETQIFGGVSMKDVEKIYVPLNYDLPESSGSLFPSETPRNSLLLPEIEIVAYDGSY